jgi:alpha-tubulin suppressor-like RCC1 family protein
VSGLPKIQQVAVGGDILGRSLIGFSVALGRDGSVWTWGSDIWGQLGKPDVLTDYVIPTKVRNISHVVDIAAGADHVLALQQNGTVWAWGLDSDGELGDGTYCGKYPCSRSIPVRVTGLPKVRAVSAGGANSAAIDVIGHVWTWGDNYSGQLGTGADCSSESLNCASNRPNLVKALDHVTQIAVASGYPGLFAHMLALRSDNALFAWGDNLGGELGDLEVVGHSSSPISIQGLDNEAISIAAGDQFSLIVRSPAL